VRAALLDAAGAAAGEVATAPVGGAYPTAEWRVGEIVRDVYAFWLPPDFPPGRYAVQVTIENETGRIGLPIRLGSIEVME
jgi:hypothetical protein